MNRLLNTLALSLVITVSCGKIADNEDSQKPIHYTAQASTPFTKTVMTAGAFEWESGDKIGLFIPQAQTNVQLSMTGVNTFSGDLTPSGNKHIEGARHIAYYPYKSSVSGTIVSGNLSSIQNAPFDGSQDLIIAETISDYDETNATGANFLFQKHLFSIIKIVITNSEDQYATEKIRRVVVSSTSSALSGDYSFDILDGTNASASFGSNNSKEITLNYSSANQPILGKSADVVLYAISKPGAIDNLKVTVYTTHYSGSISNTSGATLVTDKINALPAIEFSQLNDIQSSGVIPTPTPPGKTYNYLCGFMGDSVFYWWAQPYLTSNWTGGVVKYYFHPEFFTDNNFLNVAVPGRRTDSMKSGFMSQIVANKPRAVFIMGGFNDMNGGVSNEQIAKNITDMADMAKSNDIIPIICSLTFSSNARPIANSPDLNNRLRQYAEANDIAFCDFYPLFLKEGVFQTGYCWDGLHPTQDGYDLMEIEVLKTLRSIGVIQ